MSAKPRRITQILSRRHVGRDYGYLLRAADGRLAHVLPHESGYALLSMVGEDSGNSEEDIATLCETFNRYFTARIGMEDMVWSHSAAWLAPEAASRTSRPAPDYSLTLEVEGPPLLSVLGASLLSHRRMAEDAAGQIASRLGVQGGAWTADVCLPGGDLYGPVPTERSITEFHHYAQSAKHAYSWAPSALIARYVRNYGSRIHRLLENCGGIADLGAEVLPGLYELELRYLMQNEWAMGAADILWRRTALGLLLPADAQVRLDAWIAEATAREFAAAV
jgi:glycerol-3-phosphate dehydrogenase